MNLTYCPIFWGIISICIPLTSFVLKSSYLEYRIFDDIYQVKYDSSLPAGFTNELNSSINEMDPASYVNNAPYLIWGGLHNAFNATPIENGIIEVGYGFSPTPTRGGATDDYTSSGAYTEFDILMTSNFAFTWGNGFGGTVDRATGLRHELGHGVGLDHTKISSRLMYASYSVGEIKTIGQDEKNGYNCIYNALCTGEEAGSGNLEFSTNVFDNDNSKYKSLSWRIETDRNSILGFNIFKKSSEGSLISLNKEIIKINRDKDVYSFEVEVGDVEYFVEIVGENLSDSRMFKF